ncbi:MAG: 16S rRNA (guanine(966)-N(2))-methyltransferase RsmD [Deltaproteobacteria bacterium]|nr:16S rRNA (guanine(966)-N(2))-methyltransferase RsmD [Deltaproteobacteria bacterium]
MIRISGGFLKGKKIRAPNISPLRPTLEKTRSAIFDTLVSRFQLKDYCVIDLFAGSGALGFEALSRGAAKAVFIENNKKLFSGLKNTAEELKVGEFCTFFLSDALNWIQDLSVNASKSLFLVDPPYKSNLSQKVLELLAHNKIDLTNSLVVIEESKRSEIDIPECFLVIKQKIFGDTQLYFLEFKI